LCGPPPPPTNTKKTSKSINPKKANSYQAREHFMNSVLKPLLDSGLLEMTIPDKPRSSKQKYRLTDKGRALLE
jgi:predicted transcriptional regulator